VKISCDIFIAEKSGTGQDSYIMEYNELLFKCKGLGRKWERLSNKLSAKHKSAK
jgi:hypothetical protein